MSCKPTINCDGCIFYLFVESDESPCAECNEFSEYIDICSSSIEEWARENIVGIEEYCNETS